MSKLAIFAEGLFAKHTGKTAHGVIRYGTREVVAVIDSTCAGRTASEVEPFCVKPVPIVASLEEALERGPDTLLIGAAPPGGKLDPAWRSVLLAAIEAGLSLEAGLHTQLNDEPELNEAAERIGVELRDLRRAPLDLTVPKGPYSRPDSVTVVHSVGSDTVIGKKVVTLELDMAARERGLRSVYVPTGQTGVAIAGWGIAVDHVISDYVAGAGERLVLEGAERGDLLFVEGQGALFHPAYSGVTLGLLHGSAPDLLVLVHKPNATHNRNYPDLPIPPLNELIAAYENVAAPVRPTRVAAIALNTSDLDEDAARAAIADAERETGLPADDVVRFGADRVLQAVLDALDTTGQTRRLIFRHRAEGKSAATSDISDHGGAASLQPDRGRHAGARARCSQSDQAPLLAGPRGAELPVGARRRPAGADGGDRGARAAERQALGRRRGDLAAALGAGDQLVRCLLLRDEA